MVQIELPFINRKRDIQFLSGLLNARPADRRILIISAETGIGKTSLVDKLLEKVQSLPIIHLKMIDHPRFVAEQGEYIQRLFAAIAETASQDNRLPDFTTFQQRRRNDSTVKAVVKGTLVHLGKKYLGDEAVKAVTDVADQAVGTFDEPPDNNLETYALDILERYDCFLRVENIQKIDGRSLERLSRILSLCPRVYSILEYTDKAMDSFPLSTIVDSFKSYDLKVDVYPVEAISPEELFAGLKPYPGILFQTLKRHYEAERGNLRVLVDLRVSAELSSQTEAHSSTSDSLATTRAVIRILGNAKRFVLAMLAAHGGEVESDILASAFASLTNSEVQALGVADLTGILNDLCGVRYVAKFESKLRIAHDSILPVLAEDPQSKRMSLLATSMWIGFYRRVVDEDDPFIPKTEALHRLALFYSSSGQLEQLLWVLEQCGHSALESLAPRRLVALFDQIVRGATQNLGIQISHVDRLLEYQGEILYDANWLDEACECFERVTQLSLPARMMYADASIGTSRAEIGFRELDALENEHQGCDRHSRMVHLSTGLIRLHGLRTAGKLDECEFLFRTLLDARDALPQAEQAFLMRGADVGLYKDGDVPEIMDCLAASITLCEKNGLSADEAAARLALCQHLGYSGRLDEATAQLDAVERLSRIVWIERYSILNNRAVLSLLKGDDKRFAVNILTRALMLATEDGDRLLILANLLGAGQGSAAPQLLRLLDEISDLSDELAKIAHYNLSLHYGEMGDDLAAEEHREKAVAMKDEPDSQFWRTALGGHTPASEGVRLRVSQRYCLTFIVHWRLTSSTFKGIDNQSA